MMKTMLAGVRTMVISLTAGSLLAACSGIEGTFEPACLAFEGDRVVLTDGRFEWDRFTDEIRIGPDDRPIDPFPDYPQHGRFRIDRGRVELTSETGERLPDRYLVEADGRLWLLDADQHAAWRAGAGLPACALAAPAGN